MFWRIGFGCNKSRGLYAATDIYDAALEMLKFPRFLIMVSTHKIGTSNGSSKGWIVIPMKTL